jgi:uncharacterized protein YhbP (UPF0306 family)
MDIQKQIQKYMEQGKIMQLATVSHDQPWISTVYYVTDEHMNIYWLSWPERRHSQELTKNPKAAIAIAIKLDKPVIGIQTEGSVERVQDSDEVRAVMQKYVAKYSSGKDFYDNFVSGKNKHTLYKFVPNTFVLFDEVHFPENGRQEWQP